MRYWYLVPTTQKKRFCHQKKMKVLTNARSEMSENDAPAGPSNQSSMVETDRGTTVFRDSFTTWTELQSPVLNKPRNHDSFALKDEDVRN